MVELELISNICGWIYVAAWGTLAYPQIFLNYRIKSVEGFKLDYPFLNFFGFAFCSIAYSVAYFLPNLPYDNYGYGAIRVQDLVFVYHNLFANLLLNMQSLAYKRGKNTLSRFSLFFVAFAWVSFGALYLCSEHFEILPRTQQLNVFLYLGYLKMVTTLIKYAPLAYWNYVRKSTEGFSMAMFIFDFIGAFFAITQEIIDYVDGTIDTLNPVKVGLALVAFVYDSLLFYQHFFLYRRNNKAARADKQFWVELPEQNIPAAVEDNGKDEEYRKEEENTKDDENGREEEDVTCP